MRSARERRDLGAIAVERTSLALARGCVEAGSPSGRAADERQERGAGLAPTAHPGRDGGREPHRWTHGGHRRAAAYGMSAYSSSVSARRPRRLREQRPRVARWSGWLPIPTGASRRAAAGTAALAPAAIAAAVASAGRSVAIEKFQPDRATTESRPAPRDPRRGAAAAARHRRSRRTGGPQSLALPAGGTPSQTLTTSTSPAHRGRQGAEDGVIEVWGQDDGRAGGVVAHRREYRQSGQSGACGPSPSM